jgi:hypothetical protein
MEVQLLATVGGALDRDRQQGRRPKHAHSDAILVFKVLGHGSV